MMTRMTISKLLSVGAVLLGFGVLSDDVTAFTSVQPELDEISVEGNRTQEGAISAQSADAYVHQYNLCGQLCVEADDRDPEQAVALAAWNFNALNGTTLALNEVCRQQIDEITDYIGGEWGWVFVTSLDAADNCEGADQRFGNVVLHRGLNEDYMGAFLSNPGLSCGEPGVECRTMVCAHVNPTANITQFSHCSAHFSNNSNNDREEAKLQANEYIYIATIYANSRPQWIGGDFNLEPSDVPPVYSSPWHNVAGGNSLSAPAPTRKVDYIWARTPGHGIRQLDCSDQIEYSDHCYMYGRVSVPSA